MKQLKNITVSGYTRREIQLVNDQIDSWYLANRPRVAWWRIPDLGAIRCRVVAILGRKRALIVVDGLLGEIDRHRERAAENHFTWQHYGTLSGDHSVLVERFKQLEAEELEKADGIETTLAKIRAVGIPEESRGYIPEITVDVI